MPTPEKTIDYYYSTRSNFTYIGAARLNAMAKASGRRIVHRPILLSVVMPPIGGMPFGERPTMLRNYSMRDVLRCAEHLGVPLLREPIHHMGPFELPSGTSSPASAPRPAARPAASMN